MQLPPDSQAEELTARGQDLLEQGDLRQAQLALEQALALWRQANQPAGAARCLRLLALVARRSRLPVQAKEYFEQALGQSRALADRGLTAELLADLGGLLASIGERDSAVAAYTQARQLYQELLDREGEGAALLAIARVHQHAGQMQAAVPFFQQAFPLLRGTERWTPELAQAERMVDAFSVAHNIFGLLGKPGKRAGPEHIAEALGAQAAAGSPTAARFRDAFSSMLEQVSGFSGAIVEQRLQQNLAGLADPDPQQRCEAARRLAGYKPAAAIEPLLEALDREREAIVQQALVQALGAYGDPALAARLRPLLEHADANVRLAAAIALAGLGERGLEQQLVDGLQTEDRQLRAQAVQMLEQSADPANASSLLPMLQDSDPKVRSKAIYALGKLRDPRALDGLIAAAGDRYQVVRWAATRVLGDLGDKRATDALIARLGDSNRDVRRSAATSLGKLKDRRAADALTAALADDWWGVRESAQAALRKLKVAPSVDVLRAQLRDPSASTRCAALEQLATQLREAAVPDLRELLADQDRSVRLAALKALAALKDRHSVPALLAELAHDDMVVQVELIEALGTIGDERAEPALVAQLKHPNPYIRLASIRTLGEIGTRECLPALAATQLHDEAAVGVGQGLNMVSLKSAASAAMHAIRARHGLKA